MDKEAMTEDQAEEIVMGWQLAGTLPEGRTRASVGLAYAMLEARDRREAEAGPRQTNVADPGDNPTMFNCCF